jgi:hypothetical protein
VQAGAPPAGERRLTRRRAEAPTALRVVPNWWLDRLPDANEPGERENLGTLRLRIGTPGRGTGFLLRAAAIVAILVLCGGVVVSLQIAVPGKGDEVAGFAVLAAVVGAALCCTWGRTPHFAFAGFDRGFLWSAGSHTYLALWADVEGVVADLVRYDGPGGAPVVAWSKRRLVLHMYGGAELRVPQHVAGVGAVVDLIQSEMYRRVRHEVERQLQAGRYVEFGHDFALGPRELICGERRWPWVDLEAVEVASGQVKVFAPGRGEPLAVVPAGQVLNLAVLVDVSLALLQAHR